MALLPYAIIIVVFAIAKLVTPVPVKEALLAQDIKIAWPGLDGEVLTVAGKVSATTTYTLPWLSSPGSMLLIIGVLVAAAYRIRPIVALRAFRDMAIKLRWAILTVASVLALAYVMNLSAQTITIGAWIAGAGAAFAFLSPILGWIGTAVTGSTPRPTRCSRPCSRPRRPRLGWTRPCWSLRTPPAACRQDDQPAEPDHRGHRGRMLGMEHQLFRKTIRWSLLLLLVLCTWSSPSPTSCRGCCPDTRCGEWRVQCRTLSTSSPQSSALIMCTARRASSNRTPGRHPAVPRPPGRGRATRQRGRGRRGTPVGDRPPDPVIPRAPGPACRPGRWRSRRGRARPDPAQPDRRGVPRRVARPGAGRVTTAALAEAVAGHGLCYPPDPGSFRVSTVGGNVATCAGGLRGLKYGVTRNYILGLEVVLPTGEIIRTGGRLWKDVAGYDLTRLLTGSEGTLG